MITFAQAMAAVEGKVCPKCLHSQLSPELHFDHGSECVCVARCEHCGEQFVVEYTQFETLAEVYVHIRDGLAAKRCPVCERTGYQLTIKCEQPSQDCYFGARCRNCGAFFRVEDRHTSVRLLTGKYE